MVGIGAGAEVGYVTGDVSRYLRVPEGGMCPPPQEKAMRFPGVGGGSRRFVGAIRREFLLRWEVRHAGGM